MKITRKQLRLWGACYDDAKIASIVPDDGMTPLEIAALEIPVEDRLWVLLHKQVVPEKDLRLLACGWAEAACHAAGWTDPRSLAAIAVARRHAVGDATEDERSASASAAWSAAASAGARGLWATPVATSEAARLSAMAAAWSASSGAASAAESSAWSSAESSAWSEAASLDASIDASLSAAFAYTWAAARAEQLADVVRVLERVDEDAKAGKGEA